MEDHEETSFIPRKEREPKREQLGINQPILGQ